MSLLLRDLSPFDLQEEIKRLLLDQRLAQSRLGPTGYFAGQQPPYAPPIPINMPSHSRSVPPFAAQMIPLNSYSGLFATALADFGRYSAHELNPREPTLEYENENEAGDGENAEFMPAFYDPDEDELPDNPYDACKDRCYQAFRRDGRDCLKKRGKVAKAICMSQAASKLGSCNAACNKHRK